MKKVSSLTFVLIMVVSFSGCSYFSKPKGPTKEGSDWPMFRYNAQRTGYNPHEKLKPPLKKVWEIEAGGGRSSPIVEGNTVYYAGYSTMNAFRTSTGKRKWSFKTEGEIKSTPLVFKETVYFGSDDGKLYALDAETGEKIWEFKTEKWIRSSPVVAGGVLYVGGETAISMPWTPKQGGRNGDSKQISR